MMKSRFSKMCDISQSIKEKVWQRDGGKCVVCGNTKNTMPNAHFISRAKGGLGIEENIVTLCTNFTENQCHYKYDNGTKEERRQIGEKIEQYLKSKYPDWDKEKLVYRRNDGNKN